MLGLVQYVLLFQQQQQHTHKQPIIPQYVGISPKLKTTFSVEEPGSSPLLMGRNALEWNEDDNNNDETITSTKNNINTDRALSKIMNISAAHFKSQALHTFVKLKIPDVLKNESMTIRELAHHLKALHQKDLNHPINEDALYRTMRLMTSLDIVVESYEALNDCDGDEDAFSELRNIKFQLTLFGKLLQQDSANSKHNNISSCILHWMEKPLNDSWYYLPEYILGGQQSVNPFERANGISSDYFYNAEDNPQSLAYANSLVRLISDHEIKSIVDCFDWSMLEGKTILDIGGYNGKVMGAVGSHYSDSNLRLKVLDLPNIVSSIDTSTVPNGVQLIGGDVMDISTLPKCDVVFMKHFLDRCMWTEEETIEILKSCSRIVPDNEGMIILGEAVIPSIDNNSYGSKYIDDMPLSLDALYMLVGRERQRTETEWKSLAKRADLLVDRIIETPSPSCYMLVLKRDKKG